MNHSFQLCADILENLKWLRNHNELCDIVLLTKGQKVFAHSCVLASHSPVLAAILQARLASENDWSILKPLIISLDEERLDPLSLEPGKDVSGSNGLSNILDIIIAFMYGEKISIEDARLSELINFSKILGLSQHFQNSQLKRTLNNHPIIKHRRKRKPDLLRNEKNFIRKEPSITCSYAVKNNDETQGIEISEYTDCEITKNLDDDKIIEILNIPLDNNTSENQINIPKSSLSDTETETWFRNELLNPIKVKILNERDNFDSVNDNHLLKSSVNKMERSLSKMFAQTETSEHTRKTSRLAISCQICSAFFHRASDLVHHVKSENHYSQVCPLCFLQLNEFSEQEIHFLQHDHPLPFFCFCCDLRFRSRAGLSMHAPKHSSTKPYLCKECGRGFKWRHAAQAHAITHRSHCHLLCDICGFSSKYTSTFKSHLKRHYNQYFPCPHPGCNFKSFRKTHLTDHIATHAKLRPHQCEVCGHSFSQAKNLRRHMRLHAPDSTLLKCAPHSKEDCPFGTTRPDKLRLHLIKKHNIIPCGRNALESDISCRENIDNSLDDVLPEKEIGAKENMEAVSTLKNVLFEDNNDNKEIFLDSTNLFGKPIGFHESADNHISESGACSSLLNEHTYEEFCISTADEKFQKTDIALFEEKIEVAQVQTPLVLMDDIEVDDFQSTSSLNIQETNTSQQRNSSCNSSYLEEGFEFLISYMPEIAESSLIANRDSSIEVILDNNSLESSFTSSQYIELPIPLNSDAETDEQINLKKREFECNFKQLL